MRRRSLLVIVLTLLALMSPAAAQWRYPPYRNVQRLDQILPGIRMAHPGRFYDAEGPFPDSVGNMHYRIKWLTPEGRVIWLDADARTGRVSGAPGPAGPPPGVRYGPGPMAPYGGGRGYYPPGYWARPGYGGGWRPQPAPPAGGRRPGF